MADSFIIAIDFGTTFSGYAFSLTPRKEKINPHLKLWGQEFGKETPKTPTCILFDEKEQFLKFGYEAQMAYVELSVEDARKQFFFQCFKMSLYGRKLSKDVTIEAANGKSMNAMKIFTEALRYMKEDALKTIETNTKGKKFIASDFNWVLTVPAIWDHSAKHFMREAATQAGIVTEGKEDKLVIALEPEAASVWCKKLPAEGFITEHHEGSTIDQSPGTKYIVADCGGGTIDITVHEVLASEGLKELHKASGNDMGGQTVDKKFKEFLREIFCDGVWDEYEREFPSEVQKMMYEFTVLKKKTEAVQITCTFNLGKIAQRKKEIEKFFETVQGASWNSGSIKISKEKMKMFFNESLNGITKSLGEILEKNNNIKYILLVGGYAESEILLQHIKSEFGNQCGVLCPFRAQEAIVKGAVMFGRNPEVVASRKSAFTYGIGVWQRFDESKHKADKKFTNKNGEWCKDTFKKLVDINEDVGWDKSREHTLYPVEEDQKAMRFRFFQTEREIQAIVYVDEWGMEEIGSLEVKMPNTKHGMDREVKLEIRFGFTEMIATATDMDSKLTESVKLDFMNQP